MYYYYINEAGQFSITHTLNDVGFHNKIQHKKYECVVKSESPLIPDICLLNGRRIETTDSRDITAWNRNTACYGVYMYLQKPTLILDFKKIRALYYQNLEDKLAALKNSLSIPSVRQKIASSMGIEDTKVLSVIGDAMDKVDLDIVWKADTFLELESINYPVLEVYG